MYRGRLTTITLAQKKFNHAVILVSWGEEDATGRVIVNAQTAFLCIHRHFGYSLELGLADRNYRAELRRKPPKPKQKLLRMKLRKSAS